MSKYIDADKLKATLETRIAAGLDGYGGNLKWLLENIDSLQQDDTQVDKMLCSQIWWEEQGWIMIPPNATVEGIDSLLKQVRKKLHEEQQDGDLEKEIEKYCRIYYNCNYPDQIQNGRCSPIMPHIVEAARYFYKLRLARKEEDK